ncbi:uncharacterized protein Z518_08993 [Rhinocladiella mackenziei CBS 650.93]|uniref:Acyl-CoA dehydrogenase/oxidase C-terminal domain-containing protein n=1 Tax=Rhinocladiella mackenziei CBS 650.93 TaxID=1442369 RepID=A0A0D2GSE1_9EURO|nr:uncharacterized protein Z518_08993 [Rhinocladiella mackenziei CBS 650.93]KIX01268.1 hypothetical protein Z518_08993 [Rhinocladiella mackenziei CBS 650.93]
MADTPLKPSSSTSGFFQALPTIPPQYTSPSSLPSKSTSLKEGARASDDPVLARVLSLYLPSPTPREVSSALHKLSRRVLQPSTLRLVVDAETNPPTLHPLTTFGEENRSDPLQTSEGWRALKDIGIEEGAVARGYRLESTDWNRRVHQYAIIHVWSATASLTMCPASMTDGAAKLLSRHLEDPDGDQAGRQAVFREAYRRLTSFDPKDAWTSGQWMTERSGGSDVSGTETLARRLTSQERADDAAAGRDHDATGMPLGPWRIDGFKWFSSATDSDMTILLAQTPGGLSAFYAPMRRRVGPGDSVQTELNGVRIQRLKNKLGTKQLPTAELELQGTRAWLIGAEGRGIKEVSAILNITRLHTAAGSVAYWSRGLAVSRAYTKVRKVRGGLLRDNPQHLRWMADETVQYWAGVHLTFLGVSLLGVSEQGWNAVGRGTRAARILPQDPAGVEGLLRVLTPVMKAKVSLRSVEGLRSCMESLGGVGYCENNEDGGILNIAKIFRDAVVNTIWEGTVSVMAEDVVRALRDKQLGMGNVLDNVLVPWIQNVLSICAGRFPDECEAVKVRWHTFGDMARGLDASELHWRGREILDHLEATVCACLLMFDACSDGDEVAALIASRWTWSRVRSKAEGRGRQLDWGQEVRMDKRIFLGENEDGQSSVRGKL